MLNLRKAAGFTDFFVICSGTNPRQTRAKLIVALAGLATKRDRNPPKKHGNIPL